MVDKVTKIEVLIEHGIDMPYQARNIIYQLLSMLCKSHPADGLKDYECLYVENVESKGDPVLRYKIAKDEIPF